MAPMPDARLIESLSTCIAPGTTGTVGFRENNVPTQVTSALRPGLAVA